MNPELEALPEGPRGVEPLPASSLRLCWSLLTGAQLANSGTRVITRRRYLILPIRKWGNGLRAIKAQAISRGLPAVPPTRPFAAADLYAGIRGRVC